MWIDAIYDFFSCLENSAIIWWADLFFGQLSRNHRNNNANDLGSSVLGVYFAVFLFTVIHPMLNAQTTKKPNFSINELGLILTNDGGMQMANRCWAETSPDYHWYDNSSACVPPQPKHGKLDVRRSVSLSLECAHSHARTHTDIRQNKINRPYGCAFAKHSIDYLLLLLLLLLLLNAVLYAFLTPVTIFCIHRKCVADLRFRARTYTYTHVHGTHHGESERAKKRLQNDNGSCSLHWGITT